MKNTKNITKYVFTAMILGGLAISAAHSHSAELLQTHSHGKTLSTAQFYQLLATTNSSQIAVNFGLPDQIQTLKNVAGDTAGVVWIYRDAVQKANAMQDAQFMIVDGEMQYVSLTNAG